MPSAKITSKGQITLPKEVRSALRLEAGDRVSFLVREGVAELRPETVDLKELYGVLRHRGKPATLEEMNQAIERSAVRSFERSGKT